MLSDWPAIVVKETVTHGNEGGVEGGKLVLYFRVEMGKGACHLAGYEPQRYGGRPLANEANTRLRVSQLDDYGVGVASEHLHSYTYMVIVR